MHRRLRAAILSSHAHRLAHSTSPSVESAASRNDIFAPKTAPSPPFPNRKTARRDDHQHPPGLPPGRPQEEDAPDQGGDGAVQGRVRGDREAAAAGGAAARRSELTMMAVEEVGAGAARFGAIDRGFFGGI